MYKLARFSVKYPTTVMMMILAVLLLGYISLTRLGVDLLPELNNPQLFVEIKSGQRPPEEMERQFVEQAEALVTRQSGVTGVTSLCRVGRALLTVQYSWETDMDQAFLDLQKSLAQFGTDDRIEQLDISQHDPNAEAIMRIAFSHPEVTDLSELRRTAENSIRNDLIRLDGVAAVEIIGGLTREIEIKTDMYVLSAHGLNIDQLAAKINSSNRNIAGGSIVEMGREYVIRGIGEFSDLDQIRNLIIGYQSSGQQESLSGSQSTTRAPIYLSEVADVDYVLSDPENIVRFNGERCLALEIFKERKFNTIGAVEQLEDELERITRSLPGYKLEVVSDQSRFIKSSVREVEQTGIIGIILAVLVLYVFLRRVGVTAVVSIAIPISVVATFNLMYFNHLSLNIMTLGGLALGAGMLVDNAIVVMENIFRHVEEGVPLREAAVRGVGQVGGAITSSTLTTIVVFLPIVYLHGASGELFKEQAWTVAFSLLSSLFVAILVIPMLAVKLLKPASVPQRTIHFRGYGRFLRRLLAHRKQVILGAVFLAALTLLVIPLVGGEFIPRADQGEFSIRITLPEGTELQRTAGTVAGIESLIKAGFDNEIEHLYSRIGPSSSTSAEEEVLEDENNAVIFVTMYDGATLSTDDLIALLNRELSNLPDVELEIIAEQTALQMTLGTSSSPLVVEIEGRDLEILTSLTDSVKARLSGLKELANLQTSYEQGRPEINVVIDRTIASQFALTADDISRQLSDILSGRETGEMNYQGDYSTIRIRQPEVLLSELAGFQLTTPSGGRVRLDETARLEYGYAPREIERVNQSRVGKVTAQMAGDQKLDKVAAAVTDALKDLDLPPDYSYKISGEDEKRREAFSNLEFALLLAIILVYMVMASQFESLLHPLVIILTLPLAAVGAVFALLLFGVPFNIMSFIGIIMLAGIAVNDSIVLVDCINQFRRSGENLLDAIVKAGEIRIRPIVMTSVTTMLALLPLTFGVGEAASLRSPMALAVIGGLTTSTLLTLIVIPCAYHLLAGKVAPQTKSDYAIND